jgi:hypothetical protein
MKKSGSLVFGAAAVTGLVVSAVTGSHLRDAADLSNIWLNSYGQP